MNLFVLLESTTWIKVLESSIPKLIDASIKIGVALIIIIVGLKVIKLLCKGIAKGFERRNIDASLRPFVLSVVSIGLKILLFLSVIGYLGISISAFAALIASAGLAIGMAFSGTLSNVAGGVVLLVLRPFKVGDYIAAGGFEGTVKSILIFHTTLITSDNKVITIPNGSLSTGNIVNYSTMDTRRIDINIRLAHGVNLTAIAKDLISVCKEDNRVFKDPEPAVISSIVDLSISIDIRFWVKNSDYWDVLKDMNEVIYAYLVEKQIQIPHPKINLIEKQN
jgi:small conductance mechanosensitive channel